MSLQETKVCVDVLIGQQKKMRLFHFFHAQEDREGKTLIVETQNTITIGGFSSKLA